MMRYWLLAVVIGGLAGYTAGRTSLLDMPRIDTTAYAQERLHDAVSRPDPIWTDMPERDHAEQPPCDAQQRQLDVYERNLVRQMRQTEEPCR